MKAKVQFVETSGSLKNTANPKLPQYTQDEINRAINVIKLLIKVRDRCLKQGIKPY